MIVLDRRARFSRAFAFARAVVPALAVALFATAPVRADQAPTSPPLAPLSASDAAMPPLDPVENCYLDLDDMTVAESLGRAIPDDPSIRFVDAVRALSGVELASAAAIALDPGVIERLGAAVEKACAGPVASVVAGRAFALASATAPGGRLTLSGTNGFLLLCLSKRL